VSARFWAIATAVTGVISLGLFVVFAMLPEMQAARACLPAGAVVQFEFARHAEDLNRIFGAAGSECRPLAIAAMDAVNTIDVLAFIPAYTAFCICAALFLSGGVWARPLTIAAIGAALLAALSDYVETTSLLGITQTLDAPGDLLKWSQLGAWSKFGLLAAHAVFCAGLCFVAEKRRVILGVLLLLPTIGVLVAAFDHVQLANVMNGAFALAWVGLLLVAAISAVRAKGASA